MLSRPPDIPSYLVASAVKIPLTMIDQGSPLTERALFVTGNIVTSLHSSTTLVLVLNLLTLHNVDPLIGKRIVLLSLCTYVCTIICLPLIAIGSANKTQGNCGTELRIGGGADPIFKR